MRHGEAKELKILLADDREDDVTLLSRWLQRAAFLCSVVAVCDGEQAVDYLSQNPPPDLLLLDLKMPRLNGFEVLEWIRHAPSLKDLPIVVISSSELATDIARAKALGAMDYFVKGISFEPIIAGLELRFSSSA